MRGIARTLAKWRIDAFPRWLNSLGAVTCLRLPESKIHVTNSSSKQGLKMNELNNQNKTDERPLPIKKIMLSIVGLTIILAFIGPMIGRGFQYALIVVGVAIAAAAVYDYMSESVTNHEVYEYEAPDPEPEPAHAGYERLAPTRLRPSESNTGTQYAYTKRRTWTPRKQITFINQ